ncbi:acyltransferase ChoActase/COT/CPT [Crepidotus variabilis]|uniref:Acyltransferase ChoActase/COT/CPT n=1 Tax=Crepidotus variabilis TaxID=179855 RepID=A0A9P6EA87_9AGAR|nr:acyltransferase ChoActase/COT/CPT [Crepidotus variabilis]
MLRTGIIRTPMRSRSSSTAAGSTRPKARGRLPVPPLRQTLDRYLASLEPFLREDEKTGGQSFTKAFALREKWANEFESGIGKVLQERLFALDHVSPHNWLDDNFWMNKAYLEWRVPLLVNSNWWLAFAEDPLIPKSALSGETNNNRAGTTYWQLRRATWLLHRMLEFRDNTLATEKNEATKTGSWLIENIENMFNICRIPEPLCDTITKPPRRSSRETRSILLMIHDWCYSVVVYAPPSPNDASSSPTLLPPGEIEARFRAVVLDVESRLAKGEKALPVGVLSADDRDNWAKNLQYLLSLSPTNHRTHSAILHSIMGVSLEHTTYSIPPPSSSRHTHSRSSAQAFLDAHLHTIRGTTQNVANRFYDKTFTLVVDPSTRAGASGEHAPLDALVPSIVAEHGVIGSLDVTAFEDRSPPVVDTDGPGWERLDWVGDEFIQQECVGASKRANTIIEDSDDTVMHFSKFGSNWIASVGDLKLSPDAFIQMAMQLAWYKTRGKFTATYETVLTRMFKHGRTETIRTFSRESRLWVLSMVDPKRSNTERFKLLRDAIASHSRRTREAMTGRGVDRHLLGLRLLLRPLSGESADLFEDDIFDRSSEWKLTTSGLSAGLLFKGTGYGTMYSDGYGINYLTAPDMIKFGVESKFSCPSTSSHAFQKAISDALDEMKYICERGLIEKDQYTHSHL